MYVLKEEQLRVLADKSDSKKIAKTRKVRVWLESLFANHFGKRPVEAAPCVAHFFQIWQCALPGNASRCHTESWRT